MDKYFGPMLYNTDLQVYINLAFLKSQILYCIGIIVILMVVKVFISSNQTEFSEERKFLYEELKKDSFFSETVELFVFEIDSGSSLPSDEVFIGAVEESDIYIGLIGQHYGNIYKDDVSATEYEFNAYSSKKHDYYFFVKKCEDRDERSKAFRKRARDLNKYKNFTTKEDLLREVKRVLRKFINAKLESKDFDSEILLDSTIDDVDTEAVELFKDALRESKIKDLFGVRELDKILEYIDAGKIDYTGTFHLNKAGALFFAKDITKFDIEHEIKMVRFNGIEAYDIIDKLFSRESFFKLIDDFNNFFSRNTRLGGTVKGWERVPLAEYPEEAVREAFINAIAHRDYTLTGGCITFYIYDDRIEIASPGNLPFPLTVETLGVKITPRHRNKNICGIFEKTKYMEHIGTGITRMRREMDEFNLPEPEFINDGYFQVILKGPNGKLILPKNLVKHVNFNGLQLNERQISALEKMNVEKIEFTHKSYAELFDISLATGKRDLLDLSKKDLVYKKKVKNAYVYYI